jgi:hypothetical protein
MRTPIGVCVCPEAEPRQHLWDSGPTAPTLIPLWLIAAVTTAWWLFHLPSPGKAIGALAGVAGIMSVREMKVLGKISWVLLLICMLVTEFRAIDQRA